MTREYSLTNFDVRTGAQRRAQRDEVAGVGRGDERDLHGRAPLIVDGLIRPSGIDLKIASI